MEQIRCRACRSFRDGHRIQRECAGCGRTLRVKDGYCRLCWVQLSGGHAWEGTIPKTVAALTAAGAKITHHQLFFDKMSPRNGDRPQPAAARRATAPSVTVLQPLSQDDIDDAAAAATPAARLIIALAGIHAARSSTIRSILLTDADPASPRLLLAGRLRPLDGFTTRLLRAWLEDRRARWPGTANPHLLINIQTALGTGPVSRTWVNAALRGHAATIEALRVDRQLEEALATGADPLHLASTFGLDPGTAVRYASSARQLLQAAAEEQDPAGFPANPRTGSAPEP